MLSRLVTLVVHKVCDVLKVVTLVGGVMFVLPILRHLYVCMFCMYVCVRACVRGCVCSACVHMYVRMYVLYCLMD